MNRLALEPVAIASFVRLVLIAAVSFGLNLTDAQFVSVMAVVEAGAALITRQQVVAMPVADAALRLPAGATIHDAKAVAKSEAQS